MLKYNALHEDVRKTRYVSRFISSDCRSRLQGSCPL